jgi:sugar-phosphatase
VTLIFDLDGVLVDSTAVVERAWRRWADERGIGWDAMLPRLHGRPGREVVAEFAPHLDALEELVTVDAYELADTDAMSVLPGALDLIELAGPEWAIVTSGGHALATGRMDAVGIPRPPVLVTAGDVTQGKPHPEPYLQAAGKLGVDPARCLVVEDAPAGVEAAQAAGMRVFAVATTHSPDVLAAADAVFATTDDVNRYLRASRDTRGPAPRSP